MRKTVITIDGPAGAGKTTVARALAEKLDFVYVDTGALYRGVAREVKKRDVDYRDKKAMETLLGTLDFDVRFEKNTFTLLSRGTDISEEVRTPEITMLASAVSALPAVRSALLGIQRGIALKHDAVFEGRDMGTVVFPSADFKFFLTAGLSVRSRRRYLEMGNQTQSLDNVRDQMARRDRDDAGRSEAPLRPADDAVRIDSSGLSVAEVVEKMYLTIRFSA